MKSNKLLLVALSTMLSAASTNTIAGEKSTQNSSLERNGRASNGWSVGDFSADGDIGNSRNCQSNQPCGSVNSGARYHREISTKGVKLSAQRPAKPNKPMASTKNNTKGNKPSTSTLPYPPGIPIPYPNVSKSPDTKKRALHPKPSKKSLSQRTGKNQSAQPGPGTHTKSISNTVSSPKDREASKPSISETTIKK